MLRIPSSITLQRKSSFLERMGHFISSRAHCPTQSRKISEYPDVEKGLGSHKPRNWGGRIKPAAAKHMVDNVSLLVEKRGFSLLVFDKRHSVHATFDPKQCIGTVLSSTTTMSLKVCSGQKRKRTDALGILSFNFIYSQVQT